jgi:cellulose synthase/poly-beta-1,6-N-acetylglucosamine synthase-like glycosyltransferase
MAKQPSEPSNDLEGVLDWGKTYVGYLLWALLVQPKTYLATILVVLIAIYVYALALVAAFSGRNRDESESGDMFFVLLVPALNEEKVIAKTVASLLALRGNFLVLVIDDASDDGTAAAVAPFLTDPRVKLLKQPPERARRGKGHVLNSGYAAVQRLRIVERYGPENVVVAVFDSDARVDPTFLQEVAPYFRDPKVAGVQAAVRMYNANHNLLTLWQHLEFAVWGKVLCRAKNAFGSATLGGNGQCARLSALAELGPAPWEASSLTEDLDLSLRLLIKGWHLRFCPAASVSQEAVPRLGRLVRQRSRWMQGHLVCWRHLPDLLRSRLPLYTRLDLLLFLLLPAAILPVGLASIGSWSYFLLSFGRWGPWDLLAWYALGFVAAPLAVASLRFDGYPSWRSIVQGHLFVFYSFAWFLAGLAACWNVMLGRRAWAKTSRVGVGSGGAEAPRPSTSSLASEEEHNATREVA